MRCGQVVIGANYGDEGKGLLTDYFVSHDPDRTLVVRFNGGAQAGHTVVDPAQRRHVFSHFGAGTLAGAPSYLSQFFIVNPILFAREFGALSKLGAKPVLFISDKAFVTTPVDMFINEAIECKRGLARHGSCGAGINETITRSQRAARLEIRARDLLHPEKLASKVSCLFETWLSLRLYELGIDRDQSLVQNFVNNKESILAQYLLDVQEMLSISVITGCYPAFDHVVFEGAQGLLLDEDRIEQWPHVTRSKTGLTNVLHLAPKFGLDALDVTYVSRTYLTRHGAGPLANESGWSLPDDTNVPNPFQGTLRFASQDWQQFSYSVQMDLRRAQLTMPRIEASIALTCADQLPPPSQMQLPFSLRYLSFGPCRSDLEDGTRESGARRQVRRRGAYACTRGGGDGSRRSA